MPIDFSAFARLRPGMPGEALVHAVGSLWKPPSVDAEGSVGYGRTGAESWCGARLTADGRIGSVSIYDAFPEDQEVVELRIGMPQADCLARYPDLRIADDADEGAPYGITAFVTTTPEGDTLALRFKDARLLMLELRQPHAHWPRRPYRLHDDSLTEAYDIHSHPPRAQSREARGDTWRQGWTLGRPPGLRTGQWPLSPRHALPLRHAFTLHLPAQYRAQDPGLVAVSLFVDEQFRDDLQVPPQWAALVADPASAGDLPADDPLRRQLLDRHPHCHAMTDNLGDHYALLWLTQAEFDGPLAEPPALGDHPWLRDGPLPDWLATTDRATTPGDDIAATCHHQGLARPLRLTVREGDPNVGRPAREWDDQNEDSGYVPMFSEAGTAQTLARFLDQPDHLGGTMAPQQGYPPFSPRYVEFTEEFAAFNFGGGSAQLDLEQNRIDWACG